MTIVASPDQIFRSTATNSTCRVATTLLGIHHPPARGCGALGGSPAQGRGDGSCPLYKPRFSPDGERPSGLKMPGGRPLTPLLLGPVRPSISRAPRAVLWAVPCGF